MLLAGRSHAASMARRAASHCAEACNRGARQFTSAAPTAAVTPLGQLGERMSKNEQRNLVLSGALGPSTPAAGVLPDEQGGPAAASMHHLHIYAHSHNTHITLTNPQRGCVISKSTGELGFKKSARGTYDAAFQLCAHMLTQIYEGGLLGRIQRLEVVLRGFGVGREAATKVLLGPEGRKLRPFIAQVSDATRTKFGGTRSRRVRRLG